MISIRQAAAAIVVSFVPMAAAAQNWTAVLMNENDAYFNVSDRHYTNGAYVSLTSPARSDCESCERLSRLFMLPAGTPAVTHRYGFFAGQSMFTPEDLSLAVPDPGDRPYAGWLYGGARLYRESAGVLDRFEVKLGVVGPASGADAVQRYWHALHWFGGVPPHGWGSQLKNEPGLVVSGQRIWRVPLVDAILDAEILPQANVSLGNVFTYAGAGASLRLGRNLAADWGPPRIEPALQGSDFIDRDAAGWFAWYVFAGVEGRAVGRNLFLDGNSFEDGPRVGSETFVADFNAGFALIAGPIALRAAYTERTHEFEAQRANDKFVSFTLSVQP
jgi:lipid A 3-O-deacylase